MADLKKFRCFSTSNGKLVAGGKSAEQNEELLKKHLDRENIVLHTAMPGSPFCIIKAKKREILKQDIKEAAVFCAKYSQAWKKSKNKKDIEVHYFLGIDIFKTKDMKLGTFGVKKFRKITAKKEDIESF